MNKRGVTVWFTGLSGSGKTTIAKRVEELLKERDVGVERLDGDVIRQSLTRDLGFSKQDRELNIERVTFVSQLLTRNGAIVLTAFISPYRAMRERARREIGSMLEVFVDAPLEVLLERDVKGLYRRALAGEIKDFTGVDDPYEAPENPDLILRTDLQSVDQCAMEVIALLEQHGFVSPGVAPIGRGTPSAGELQAPGLTVPHGGQLINRELEGEAREHALERAKGLRQVTLDERELADVEMIGIGALSPLTGFMRRLDYECVVDRMRLSDGTVWPLPITLHVSEGQAKSIALDSEIALVAPDGTTVALMQVTDKFRYDKLKEAERVFGTSDMAHPGVVRLFEQGEVLLGGPIWVVNRPGESSFAEHRLTPAQTRHMFSELGWKRVVAFQTRNPVHRAHEYLQKVALEGVDGLLLHPLVGATKSDDIAPDVRMRAYDAILTHYYPSDRVRLAVFPAAMRYAGPREAVFHALCRKNYGCTHFIVGRDHAGVGNYYGTYDAQKIFEQFTAAELGITPLCFEHAFFCRACAGMATTKTCPHPVEEHVFLSGTKVRGMLRDGQLPPLEFTRPEVAEVLLEAMQADASSISV